jgi:hypothetical protein
VRFVAPYKYSDLINQTFLAQGRSKDVLFPPAYEPKLTVGGWLGYAFHCIGRADATGQLKTGLAR